ncbi:MAG: hypothetical protein NC489_07940 [Ruminococcus flavefaciens]|nr:hypothetical protein [Ruminococcus flavefaciens]
MKMNKKYAHVAYIRTAIALGSMEDLAERISKYADLEISKVKTSGFVLRQTSDYKVSEETLIKSIFEGICDALEVDIEETTDYITENYDFVFNPDDIDKDRLAELFDISRDGRLIYIELDL